MKSKKYLALLLALAVLTGFALTACGKDPEPAEPSQPEESLSEAEPPPSSKVFLNTLADLDRGAIKFPTYTELVKERYNINTDTVGWLEVPGTDINDVIVCRQDPADLNNYYYRRDFYKNYSFNGVLYCDFRNTFEEGDKDSLSMNTVIYGHTVDTKVDATIAGGGTGAMFAPLKYFIHEDFAKKTPYVYFSTAKEDLVWEVFAVFYATINLPYNRPDLTTEEFGKVLEECVQRSIYNYDVDVSASDKILTLSTCTYLVPTTGQMSNLTNMGYPNDYRYVIMAKLVDKSAADKTEASFTLNPSPKAP